MIPLLFSGPPSRAQSPLRRVAGPTRGVTQSVLPTNRPLRTAIRTLGSGSFLILGAVLAFVTASYNSASYNSVSNVSGPRPEMLAERSRDRVDASTAGAIASVEQKKDSSDGAAIAGQPLEKWPAPYRNASYPGIPLQKQVPTPEIQLGPIVFGDAAAASVSAPIVAPAADPELIHKSVAGADETGDLKHDTVSTSRVVIDALMVDVAMRDSVAPGTEVPGSQFGIVEESPWTVVNSLKSIGKTTVIAANRMHVVSGQSTELQWTERASDSPTACKGRLERATTIRIRPLILSDGRIRLELHPESSRMKPGTRRQRPEVVTMTFTTDVVLKEGATAVIGGFVEERSTEIDRVIVNGKAPGTQIRSPLPSGIIPKIQPQQPAVRYETILLVMPQIVRDR